MKETTIATEMEATIPERLTEFVDTFHDNKKHHQGQKMVSLVNKYIWTSSDYQRNKLDVPNLQEGYILDFEYFVTEANLFMVQVHDSRSYLDAAYTISMRPDEVAWKKRKPRRKSR